MHGRIHSMEGEKRGGEGNYAREGIYMYMHMYMHMYNKAWGI